MTLLLNEEQIMLQESARGFLESTYPVSHFRDMRAAGKVDDEQIWQQMIELGWSGLLIDEEFDGVGFGLVGAGVIAEEIGRTLTPSPFLSTGVVAAGLLQRHGSTDQKQSTLPKIAAGELKIGIAIDEGKKHAPEICETSAETTSLGILLSGEKTLVLSGTSADLFIVSAKSKDTGQIDLYLVDADAQGLSRTHMQTIDRQDFARVVLNGVEISSSARVTADGNGVTALDTMLSLGRLCLCSEMLGCSERAFEIAVDYLKEREQFGRTIGSFQGLQHRAAILYTELALARSITLKAQRAFETNAADVAKLVSIAKAKVGEVARLVTQESIQFHGGIGVTDEYDVGLYLKRVRVCSELYGGFSYHADKVARANGY